MVKALALGARAGMIGRAYLWRLGANGQACVELDRRAVARGFGDPDRVHPPTRRRLERTGRTYP